MSELSIATKGNRTGGMQGPAMPVKTLAALTLAVLLAHAVVLQGTSLSLRASENKVTRPFTTRVIEINAVPPDANESPTGSAVPTPATVLATAREKARAKARARAPVRAVVARPVKPAARPSDDASSEARSDAVKNTDSSDRSESNQAVTGVPATQIAINTVTNDFPEVGAVIAPAAVPNPAASSAQALASAASPSPTAATPSPSPGSAAGAQTPSAPPATTAYTVPGSVRLKYNVTGGKDKLSYSARAELLWLQDGNTYEARQEVGAFLMGSRVFTSTGRMTADGLAPLRYSDKARNELAAHFDRERQRVTFSANTPESPLQSGAQDRVSVFVQMASMLAGAPDKYPAGTRISVQIIGPRATEVWAIAAEGEEKLNLPGGELSAVKFTRAARGEFDLKTEFWLAPVLGYLPARIRFTQANGDFVDMAWRATEAP